MCPIPFRQDGALAFMAFETFTRLIDQFAGARDLHLQGLASRPICPVGAARASSAHAW
jgi:hypothetical protein